MNDSSRAAESVLTVQTTPLRLTNAAAGCEQFSPTWTRMHLHDPALAPFAILQIIVKTSVPSHGIPRGNILMTGPLFPPKPFNLSPYGAYEISCDSAAKLGLG